MWNTTTIADITPLTEEERLEKERLCSDEEHENWVSQSESRRRSALIFKSQANEFKILATDEHINKKSDNNYKNKAIKNWEAYLKYSM